MTVHVNKSGKFCCKKTEKKAKPETTCEVNPAINRVKNLNMQSNLQTVIIQKMKFSFSQNTQSARFARRHSTIPRKTSYFKCDGMITGEKKIRNQFVFRIRWDSPTSIRKVSFIWSLSVKNIQKSGRQKKTFREVRKSQMCGRGHVDVSQKRKG